MATLADDAISEFAATDENRINGLIAKHIARKSPYMNVFPGGTFPANFSQVQRSVVQGEAALGNSLTVPNFVSSVDLCGDIGQQDQVGSTEYQYQLQGMRGRGPRVCIKQAYNTFEDAYVRAYESLKDGMRKLVNADVRATAAIRSGTKFICRSTQSFEQNILGTQAGIDQDWGSLLPDSQPTFKVIRRLGRLLKEDYGFDMYDTSAGEVFKLIGSDDLIESLRNDTDVKSDMNVLTQGSFKYGSESIKAYQFEVNYRGFAFGVDPQPLRATGINADGTAAWIAPQVPVATSNGVEFRVNPNWAAPHIAQYEVALLFAPGTFERLTPEKYTGEGEFNWPAQLSAMDLKWWVPKGDDNAWQDYGQHIYQIERAYKPIRPHGVIAILYRRCPFATGLAACATTSSGL